MGRLARPPGGTDEDLLRLERALFDEFRFHAEKNGFLGDVSDMDALLAAQHYGVPTRLLDWSQDARVAAYFAAEKDWKTDGEIIGIKLIGTPSDGGTVHPFDISKEIAFFPDSNLHRAKVQKAVVTITAKPWLRLHFIEQLSLIIRSEHKCQVISGLERRGISRFSLFPDFSGLADMLCSKYTFRFPGSKAHSIAWRREPGILSADEMSAQIL